MDSHSGVSTKASALNDAEGVPLEHATANRATMKTRRFTVVTGCYICALLVARSGAHLYPAGKVPGEAESLTVETA